MNITVRPTRKISVSESELLETNIIVAIKDLCNMDSTVILELMTAVFSFFPLNFLFFQSHIHPNLLLKPEVLQSSTVFFKGLSSSLELPRDKQPDILT